MTVSRCADSTSHRFLRPIVLVAAAALFCACGSGGTTDSQTSVRYQVRDAGPLRDRAVARDLDDSGRVVGTFTPDETGHNAFLWDERGLAEYRGRSLRALNSSGDLVGETDGVAYLWSGDTVVPLAYGTAWDVSNSGFVVGEGYTASGTLHGFRWQAGELTDLGTLGGDWSVAYGVNEAGTVVGWAEQADGQVRAFRSNGTALTALETLGGGWSMAYAVNDADEVTGYAANAEGEDHAFLADADGKLTDLGSLGGHSIGYAIDNRGRVVGESSDTTGNVRAFLWQKGQMVDLNALIPAESGWTLLRAIAINDRGQIIGEGRFAGEERPFLLTPVGEE